MSTTTAAALIGLVGAIIAAIIGLFATDQITVIVPALDIGPDIAATQEENTRLEEEARGASDESGDLARELEAASEANESLNADNDRLRAKLREVGVDPDEEATTRTEVYRDREFELTGSQDYERAAFVDLDTGDANEMLESEWHDTVESDGPSADLALHTSGGDWLGWSGLGARSSESAAPMTPVACEDAAMVGPDEYISVGTLDAGDVICLITTDGSLARVEIVSANADDDPPRVEIKVSLWE